MSSWKRGNIDMRGAARGKLLGFALNFFCRNLAPPGEGVLPRPGVEFLRHYIRIFPNYNSRSICNLIKLEFSEIV
jgi:hypothetical protein